MSKEMLVVLIERGGGYGRFESSINIYKNRIDALARRNPVFTSLCSTIPDYPMSDGKYNDGIPDGTLKNGRYFWKPHIQKIGDVKWRVLKYINEDGSWSVPVIRFTGEDTSTGVNAHFRDDETTPNGFAWSTLCTTMLKHEFKRMREVLGVPDGDNWNEDIIAEVYVMGQVLKGVYREKL
jgi:hypothetical protein